MKELFTAVLIIQPRKRIDPSSVLRSCRLSMRRWLVQLFKSWLTIGMQTQCPTSKKFCFSHVFFFICNFYRLRRLRRKKKKVGGTKFKKENIWNVRKQIPSDPLESTIKHLIFWRGWMKDETLCILKKDKQPKLSRMVFFQGSVMFVLNLVSHCCWKFCIIKLCCVLMLYRRNHINSLLRQSNYSTLKTALSSAKTLV